MSHTYAERKEAAGAARQTDAAKERSPSDQHLDALSRGLVQPSAEQMGHKVDLPGAIRAKMEASFGTDLSAVRLYESQTVADAGVEAVSRGSDIAFAPGNLDFSSRSGQALLGHELSHVVSQARGEVTGSGFLNDPSLEARADREGFMAASGEQIYGSSPVTGALPDATPAAAAGPMQAAGKNDDKAKLRSQVGAQKAAHGDFSDYANVRPDDRETVLNPKKLEIAERMNDISALRRDYGTNVSDMLNPVTREAMSKMSKDRAVTGSDRRNLIQVMDEMDQSMMMRTMLPVTAQQEQALYEHYRTGGDLKRLQREYQKAGIVKRALGTETMSSEEVDDKLQYIQAHPNSWGVRKHASKQSGRDITRAQNSGDAMLRMMLLMQMGHFTQTTTTKDDAGQTHKSVNPWDRTMAHALSHGARVGFAFGQTTQSGNQTYDTNAIFQSLFGRKTNAAGVTKRSFATHRLMTPDAGKGMNGYEEQHGFLAALKGKLDLGYHNYGMDMAIGGAGNEGVAGPNGEKQIITADGRSGHMYMGVRDSGKSTRGGMLVGLETDSPYRMNQTGHMHTAAAVGEDNSSTGGMKEDIVGDKYGGRTVDFEGATNEDIVTVLDAFSRHLKTLQEGGGARMREYQTLVESISGPRMSDDAMETLMRQIMGDDEYDARSARLLRARSGGG